MTTNQTISTTGVDLLLDGIQAGSVSPDAYASEANLDAVVPGWRFAVRGGAAIAEEYGRWFAHPAELLELRRSPTATGEVIEYTVAWTEDRIPHAGRHVHVLTLDEDTGRIVTDHVWCGGRWPAALLAEMEAAQR